MSLLRSISLILLVYTSLGALTPLEAAPVFGRYSGVLHHEAQQKDQLAKLDFVVARKGANELDLKAVLTLYQGDFGSAEYLSFNFPNVRYNILTGTLIFHESTQGVSLFVNKFEAGHFEGEVISRWNGNIGTIRLSQDKAAVPQFPIHQPLGGEYTGACGVDRAKLQLFVYRNSEGTGHLAQPFFSYNIKGNLPIGCADGDCVNIRIVGGSFNPFAKKNQLTLEGTRFAFRCDYDGDTINCSTPASVIEGSYDFTNCRFKRTSEKQALQLSPVVKPGGFSVPKPGKPDGDLKAPMLALLQSGEYKGYVFHEFRGIYQSATLNLKVFQGIPSEGTRIASQGNLYFGDHDSPEVIPYSFAETSYPAPTSFPQNLVLNRTEDDIDAMVQITEVSKGVIRGYWHSVIFGRVGPFELRKEGLPQLPEGATVMPALSGLYRGAKTHSKYSSESQWQIRLVVTSGNTPAGKTENPFFPNTLRGSMYLYPITPSLSITDGSYDFYTGLIGFSKNQDNGSQHSWVGTQLNASTLKLHQAVLPVLTPLPKYQPEIFRLERSFP